MTEKEAKLLVKKIIEYSNYEGYIDFNEYFANQDIEAIETVLQLLEQKDNKINKVKNKLREVQEDFINYCPDCVDLANDILKILEE